ncbi:basic amino acid ABC transporter substrate-binding protein [Fictibacillus iocasae]|uniref:Basic amino acid ABC transporter substrate-binding protein n=1 Tax=Fictibacillus iocasae TaxID=2715437 RepID=A0ABW2NRS3_9BACL
MRKQTVFSVVVMVAMLLLAACSDSGDGKVIVATDAAYAPFEFLKDGKMTGFDIELLEAVMKEAGVEYEVKNTGWEPLFTSLNNKEVQAGISAITINDKRLKTYDFSDPYFESVNMILTKEDSEITSAKDLEGKNVGVQNGTTGQEALEKLFGKNNSNIKKYKSNVLAIQSLMNGEVEAVVADNGVVQEYVKNNPDKKVKSVEDKTNFESEFYGIIFPKKSEHVDDVNKGLKKVIESGKYAEIYKKWFGEEPDVEVLKK